MRDQGRLWAPSQTVRKAIGWQGWFRKCGAGLTVMSCLCMFGAASPMGRADTTAYLIKPDDVLLWSADAPGGASNTGWAWKGKVAADGMLNLGPYGSVKVGGLTMAAAKAAIEKQILSIKTGVVESANAGSSGVRMIQSGDALEWVVDDPHAGGRSSLSGKVVVDSAGNIDLAGRGRLHIAGMTAEEARLAIAKKVLSIGDGAQSCASAQTGGSTWNGASMPAIVQTVGAPPRGSTVSDYLPPIQSGIAPFSRPAGQPIVPVAYDGSGQSGQSSPPVALLASQTATDRSAQRYQMAQEAPRREGGRDPLDTYRFPPAPGQSPTLPPPAELPSTGSKTAESLPAPASVAPQTSDMPAFTAAPGMDRPIPQECAKIALPPYVIEPPDILVVESTQSLRDQAIRGQHLVRPDGTIGLGIYGSVFVAGMTLDQARSAIASQIALRVKDLDPQNLYVDVLAYNSKVYYIITDGGGYGEQVTRVPVTGNETVLDAISQINGLPPVASKKHVWIARPICGPSGECDQRILPIDWIGITQGAATATNYQILPGDRLYVKADHWITFDSAVAKVLAPFERMVGFTLLTADTVQTIRNRNGGGGTGTGF